MPTSGEFLAACKAELGYTESPPGSNCNKFSQALGRPCEAWCADFLVAMARKIGLALPSTSASAQYMLDAFRAAGRAFTAPVVGDFAFWQFDSGASADHVSVVESLPGDGTVSTVDGNSSVAGSQSNGGEVCERNRSRNLVIAYGRPVYSTTAPNYTEATGMVLRNYVFSVAIGADGHGWMGPSQGLQVDGLPIPFASVGAVIANGPYPPRDGYWPLPVLAKHNENGNLVVVATGSPGVRSFWVEVLQP